MRTSWLTRFKVILLAAVVLAGGSGLPVLDAVLYHTRGPDARRAGARVEPTGTPGTHADRCTLGRAVPVPRPEASCAAGARLTPFAFRREAQVRPAAPRAVHPPTPLHSRAPPTLAV